jgi:hypothetical protein
MSVLDWSFVSLISVALLFMFFSLVLLFSSIRNTKKLKFYKKRRPPKNKKKRKRFIRAKRSLEQSMKKQLTWGIILFIFAGAALGGASYSRYYQQNHLQGKDSEAIVQGYYALQETAKQLENIKQNDNPQKSLKNLRQMAAKMTTYGYTKASSTLKEDGQVLLNRYFTRLKELGTNLYSQKIESLQDEETYTNYMNDIKKSQETQAEVFKRFNINEDALKKKQ